MLFNSYDFIFLFLISVLFGWFVLKGVFKQSSSVFIYYLILVSIIFYGQWSLEHLVILLVSITINYIYAINKKINNLYFIIILNLLPLIYYKYSGFLSMSEDSLVLPLAISFFTFQQIAFQVDLYKGKIKLEGFDKYLFFVLFFPQLVAGPIVHYNDLVGQFKQHAQKGIRLQPYPLLCIQQGILLFSIGLFKKVVLADSLAPYANSAFGDVAGLSFYDAWIGLFAYSFEIYFDFSGYADMAIGLALLFGFRLPINFLSPYKSRNIVEFWRNWHITLSTFLKEHLYIPLGGNRFGMGRSVVNLLVTMTIGGIWHGAGWTFVLWGFMHGVFLGVVHLFSGDQNRQKGVRLKTYPFLSVSTVFTFMIVTLLWVLFRAESFSDALIYYDALFHISKFDFSLQDNYLIIVSFIVVWVLPNSMEFSKYMSNNYRPSSLHALFSAVLFFISLKVMANTPALTFVYFNF